MLEFMYLTERRAPAAFTESTSPFFIKHNSNRPVHDHFIKAVYQKGNGEVDGCQNWRRQQESEPGSDRSCLTPLDDLESFLAIPNPYTNYGA